MPSNSFESDPKVVTPSAARLSDYESINSPPDRATAEELLRQYALKKKILLEQVDLIDRKRSRLIDLLPSLPPAHRIPPKGVEDATRLGITIDRKTWSLVVGSKRILFKRRSNQFYYAEHFLRNAGRLCTYENLHLAAGSTDTLDNGSKRSIRVQCYGIRDKFQAAGGEFRRIAKLIVSNQKGVMATLPGQVLESI